MVSHTTEDAMFTALGYACGRFTVVIFLILISALLMFLLLLFVRLVKLSYKSILVVGVVNPVMV